MLFASQEMLKRKRFLVYWLESKVKSEFLEENKLREQLFLKRLKLSNELAIQSRYQMLTWLPLLRNQMFIIAETLLFWIQM